MFEQGVYQLCKLVNKNNIKSINPYSNCSYVVLLYV